jgi:hypothetical protein
MRGRAGGAALQDVVRALDGGPAARLVRPAECLAQNAVPHARQHLRVGLGGFVRRVVTRVLYLKYPIFQNSIRIILYYLYLINIIYILLIIDNSNCFIYRAGLGCSKSN